MEARACGSAKGSGAEAMFGLLGDKITAAADRIEELESRNSRMAEALLKSQSRESQLEAALRKLIDVHVQLIDCGDCGNWDSALDKNVIAARNALVPNAGATASETSAELEKCPGCNDTGKIDVYCNGVFEKAIDCGLCSAVNRGVAQK